jgi:hypothetical protein
LIMKTYFTMASYLNEEVNCTEPSPSVRVPCLRHVNHYCTTAQFTVS